jgi:hypothetical protein
MLGAPLGAEETRAVFAADNPQQFDLVLVDHALSGMRGEELAADFLCLRSDNPIALYTGANVSLEEVAVQRYLCRPSTLQSMSRCLSKWYPFD